MFTTVRRSASIAALAAVLLLGAASAAIAYVRASGPEKRGIVVALRRNTEMYCGGRSATVVGAIVSTVNRRYAATGCGGRYDHFYDVLRRSTPTDEAWKVVFAEGDGIQPCALIRRHVPENVIRDLGLGGTLAHNKEGRC